MTFRYFLSCFFFFFFFNDTATTEIYTLSLHDVLPIFFHSEPVEEPAAAVDDASLRSLESERSPSEATVAAEMAELTNWRREISDPFVISTSGPHCSLEGLRRSHATLLRSESAPNAIPPPNDNKHRSISAHS